jgi:hypothetical protein
MHVRPADFYLTHEVQPGNWKLPTKYSLATCDRQQAHATPKKKLHH